MILDPGGCTRHVMDAFSQTVSFHNDQWNWLH